MKVLAKRVVSGLLGVALLIGMLPTAALAAEGGQGAQQRPGLGTVSLAWSRDIFKGVSLDYLSTENELGLQKSRTVSYDPKAAPVKPILSYGPTVMGGDMLSDMADAVAAEGKKVVFAINGDAYDTSNGVSNGLMIKDGLLISTSHDDNAYAVGFKEDGSAI